MLFEIEFKIHNGISRKRENMLNMTRKQQNYLTENDLKCTVNVRSWILFLFFFFFGILLYSSFFSFLMSLFIVNKLLHIMLFLGFIVRPEDKKRI